MWPRLSKGKHFKHRRVIQLGSKDLYQYLYHDFIVAVTSVQQDFLKETTRITQIFVLWLEKTWTKCFCAVKMATSTAALFTGVGIFLFNFRSILNKITCINKKKVKQFELAEKKYFQTRKTLDNKMFEKRHKFTEGSEFSHDTLWNHFSFYTKTHVKVMQSVKQLV